MRIRKRGSLPQLVCPEEDSQGHRSWLSALMPIMAFPLGPVSRGERGNGIVALQDGISSGSSFSSSLTCQPWPGTEYLARNHGRAALVAGGLDSPPLFVRLGSHFHVTAEPP